HSTQGTDSDGIQDDFAVTLTDSDGDVATTTLTIDVKDDVPDAVDDDGGEINENTPITVDVLANDVAGADGPLTLTGASLDDPAQGSVTFNAADGTVTFTPADGFDGEAVISYSVVDADGDTDSAT
ncbi:Ig-like domain-containing protein, partial [Halomonas sp. V046]|uniref:Ig-like domain-containing protein n=1 Tax=Halomonas sp. V046 TaxID=3459611 RepID=UPI004043F1C7